MARDHNALAAYLTARASRPFGWGREQNDCVAFALGAVEAQRGTPLKLKATWTTARGAARVLKRLGGLEPAVSRYLTPVAPSLARRGDIALVVGADGVAGLMVVEGETLVGPDASGARRLPRSAMAKAWSAG